MSSFWYTPTSCYRRTTLRAQGVIPIRVSSAVKTRAYSFLSQGFHIRSQTDVTTIERGLCALVCGIISLRYARYAKLV